MEGPAMRRRPLPKNKTANHRNKPEKASIGGGGRSDWGSRMGKAAGDCAAVCCCCPCAVVHLILAAYRLPRCLWKRRKRRRDASRNRRSSSDETEMKQRKMSTFRLQEAGGGGGDQNQSADNDVGVAWEHDIWHGFWRSSSWRTNDE